jgi:hypothetical protein
LFTCGEDKRKYVENGKRQIAFCPFPGQTMIQISPGPHNNAKNPRELANKTTPTRRPACKDDFIVGKFTKFPRQNTFHVCQNEADSE